MQLTFTRGTVLRRRGACEDSPHSPCRPLRRLVRLELSRMCWCRAFAMRCVTWIPSPRGRCTPLGTVPAARLGCSSSRAPRRFAAEQLQKKASRGYAMRTPTQLCAARLREESKKARELSHPCVCAAPFRSHVWCCAVRHRAFRSTMASLSGSSRTLPRSPRIRTCCSQRRRSFPRSRGHHGGHHTRGRGHRCRCLARRCRGRR